MRKKDETATVDFLGIFLLYCAGAATNEFEILSVSHDVTVSKTVFFVCFKTFSLTQKSLLVLHWHDNFVIFRTYVLKVQTQEYEALQCVKLQSVKGMLQLTFTCSKSAIETLEKGVKYVQ